MTNDPFETTLQTTLRERYGNPPPVERLWEQVAPAIIAAPHPQPLPTRRKGIVSLWQRGGTLRHIAAILIPFILIASLLGGTAFAVSQHFWGVFVHDQGAGGAFLKKLGKTVQLTQAHQGYTMTISWVYSDSIRTIIGYTIVGPAGHNFKAFDFANDDVVLQTDAGQQLPLLNGASDALSSASAQEIIYFDTSTLSHTSTTLALHLRIAKFTAEDDVNNAPTYTPIVVPGPFHFDYTTPYYAGQTINMQQTLSANGKAVTLERVVVTPSAAQAYLKLSFPIAADEKFFGVFIAPHGAGNLGVHGGVSLHQEYDPATNMVISTSVQVSSQSPGQWSVDARLFQLDQKPNPAGGKPSGDGTLFDLNFPFVVK